MIKRLSEELANLSARAKKDVRNKILADEANAAVKAVENSVKQDIKSLSDAATKDWNAARATIAAGVDAVKADMAGRKK